MIPDSRKLKRGLEDISPLFGGGGGALAVPQTAPAQAAGGGVQAAPLCFSQVLCADMPGESARLLARELAFKYSNPSRFSGVLSIAFRAGGEGSSADGPGSFAREAVLNMDELDAAHHLEVSESQVPALPGLVFIEFDPWNAACFEKVVPALDQWIITASPRMESLAEAYKWMKASQPLNPRLEYFLLLEAADTSKGIYERYADFVARNLGIRLSALGSVHFLKGARPHLSMELDLAQAESVRKAAKHPVKKNLASFLAA